MKETGENNLECPWISRFEASGEELTELEKRQIRLEKEYSDSVRGAFTRSEDKLLANNRGSQTKGSRGLMYLLVPAMVIWLDNHVAKSLASPGKCGVSFAEYTRMLRWCDSYMMAHIGLSVVLDALGRGSSFKTKINTLQMRIGKTIEDQAFISYMEEVNPKYFALLQKVYLHDPVRTYDKKVYGMKHALEKSENMQWEWMDETTLMKVGGLVLTAAMSVPSGETGQWFFEKKMIWDAKNKSVDYLGLTETGIRFRDKLQEAADRMVYKPIPMLCPPKPWSLDERGGYLTTPPRKYAELIHGNDGTVPSQSALDAINRLQRQPYNINKFIYNIQRELLKKTHEIGCFRSYEAESWKDEHFPLYDSDYIASLEKRTPEYRKVMRHLRDAYHKQRLDEKEADTPRRILTIAEKFLDETFYTPWFFDTRLRMYATSPLSITNGDFVKALLVAANPVPVTDTSRNELLIAIATSGAFDKIDKASYDERIAWAEEFVASGEFLDVVRNPLNNNYWREADEPFQFLSYCEEFYSVFVLKARNTVRTFIGRDMTCSGIQILSSVIGDHEGMKFTNVIPSDTPQDAYAEVARYARGFLSCKVWVKEAIDQQEQKRIKWNKKHPDDQREQRLIIEIEIETIDRGVVKTQVMVTGYGGTYQSKRGYIIEKLRERGVKLHPQDETIIVKACIEGMAEAFPAYSKLNEWFKKVALAACKQGLEQLTWVSPNGSLIAQEYREPNWIKVMTHAASGAHYNKLITENWRHSRFDDGTGDVDPFKHQSAIAANFTHTLDACMIQEGMNALDDGVSAITVHDCVYFQPGYSDQVVPHFRKAFHNVVTSPVLENLIEENGLDGVIDMMEKQEADLSVCLDSQFLFS